MHSLFQSADWLALLWAATMASLTGWSQMRIRQRTENQTGTIADVIADTLIGTTAGLALALAVPEQMPHLKTLGGITALACVGGAGGRRVYDLLLAILEYVARLKIGVKDIPRSESQGGAKDDVR